MTATTDGVLLIIDMGSSSVRTSWYSVGGARLAGGMQVSYTLQATPDGGVVMETAQALAGLVDVVDGALAEGVPGRVLGVACSSMVPNLLGIDAQGNPLTPVYTYADTRSAATLDALRETEAGATCHQRTGAPLHSSYWPAQLWWQRTTEPARWDQVTCWLGLADYFGLLLFGEAEMSLSCAAWSGLLNRTTRTWDTQWLETVGIEVARLPKVQGAQPWRQGLREPWASRWPHLRGVPWLLPQGDGLGATVGSGGAAPGRLALTIGTSSALRTLVHGPLPATLPSALWCYTVAETQALLGGATTEGGGVHAWLSARLQIGSDDALEAEIAAMAPDAHGLTVLPFLAGERSPGWRAEARGTIHGLTLATTPAEIIRAGLEAVALRLALIASHLPASLSARAEVVGSGGALRASPTWATICADALGMPLLLSDEREMTSRGTALLALAALGLISDPTAADPPFRRRIEPNMEFHAIYQRALARQIALYERVTEL